MSKQPILPILVASRVQNDAEHLNGLLRGLGMRVRSDWGGDAEMLDKALSAPPELVFFVADDPPLGLEDLVRLRDLRSPDVPIVALGRKPDGLDVAMLMGQGVRDLVGMDNSAHLKAVIERELPVARMTAQLQRYADALADYEARLTELLSESADAIAYLQDGIHMRANPAYLALFGYTSADDIEGIPVMDVFDGDSQGALKTAIQQAVKHGKTTDDLELQGVNASSDNFPVTVSLAPEVVDGENCIRLAARVAQLSPELEQQLGEREREAAALKESLADVRHRDPLTGVYHRAYFLEQLSAVKTDKKAVRALALVTADQFASVEASVGAYASGRIINSLVELINESVGEKEPVGRYDDDTFAILLTRAALPDIDKWAAQMCKTVSEKVFDTGSGSTSLTCSIGLTEIESLAGPELLLTQALEASESANKQGGNRHVVYQPPAVNAAQGGSDASWVKRITSALKGNTLQLVYQQIASLEGANVELQDVLVQMKDGEGGIIAAANFMPAAERHDLMPAIDKWVIKHLIPAAIEYNKRNKARFFARVSVQFLTDPKMLDWLRKLLDKAPSKPAGSLIFQISESYLNKHLMETKRFIDLLREVDCGLAIAQFGMGRNSLGVLDHLKPNFIKLDDELLGSMNKDADKRDKISALVEKAKAGKIEVIAHRIESADAIATLWQMGVQYIQGNYLQEAGAVIQDGSVAPPARRAAEQRR